MPSIVFKGNKVKCARWLPFARGQLNNHVEHGDETVFSAPPKPKVGIRANTEIDRVFLSAKSGGLFVAFVDSDPLTTNTQYLYEKKLVDKPLSPIRKSNYQYGDRYWYSPDLKKAVSWDDGGFYIKGGKFTASGILSMCFASQSQKQIINSAYPSFDGGVLIACFGQHDAITGGFTEKINKISIFGVGTGGIEDIVPGTQLTVDINLTVKQLFRLDFSKDSSALFVSYQDIDGEHFKIDRYDLSISAEGVLSVTLTNLANMSERHVAITDTAVWDIDWVGFGFLGYIGHTHVDISSTTVTTDSSSHGQCYGGGCDDSYYYFLRSRLLLNGTSTNNRAIDVGPYDSGSSPTKTLSFVYGSGASISKEFYLTACRINIATNAIEYDYSTLHSGTFSKSESKSVDLQVQYLSGGYPPDTGAATQTASLDLSDVVIQDFRVYFYDGKTQTSLFSVQTESTLFTADLSASSSDAIGWDSGSYSQSETISTSLQYHFVSPAGHELFAAVNDSNTTGFTDAVSETLSYSFAVGFEFIPDATYHDDGTFGAGSGTTVFNNTGYAGVQSTYPPLTSINPYVLSIDRHYVAENDRLLFWKGHVKDGSSDLKLIYRQYNIDGTFSLINSFNYLTTDIDYNTYVDEILSVTI